MQPRSSEQLALASQHLQYEIWMLEKCALQYTERNCFYAANAPIHERVTCNALLESVAIHSRVLIEFFYTDKAKFKQDVLAVYYFDSASAWIEARPVLSDYLVQTKKWADFRVAHLSFSRQEDITPFDFWNIKTILTEIAQVMLKFVDLVPHDRIDDSLQRWCRQYRTQLEIN